MENGIFPLDVFIQLKFLVGRMRLKILCILILCLVQALQILLLSAQTFFNSNQGEHHE